MTLRRDDRGEARGAALGRSAGFTVVEFVIATAVVTVLLIGLVVFAEMAIRSMMGITKQNAMNEQTGHAVEVILGRIRLANGVANDSAGNVLTLSFDDNIHVDSNADGNPYNDTNHLEQIKFGNGDGQDGTTADNRITYRPDTTATNTTVLLSGVRKLPGFQVFRVTNAATVLINYGLLDDVKGDSVQAVEIKARGVRRN